MAIDHLLGSLKRGLDAAVIRHELIADNVSNITTPGYRRKDLDFKVMLKTGINQGMPAARTHKRHFDFANIMTEPASRIVYPNNTDVKQDGNNVDLDREIVNMANNNVYYNSLTTLAGRKLRLLRDAVG